MASSAYVHRYDRIQPILQATASGTGKTNRGHWLVYTDSNGFITPQKNSDGSAETTDQPGGNWEGITWGLKARGYTIWGLQLCYGTIGSFSSDNSFAVFPAESTSGVSIDPSTAGFLSTSSFPYAAANFAGWIEYVPAGGPWPADNSIGTTSSYLHTTDQYVGSSTWVNRYPIGDPKTTDVRLVFSYATNSAVNAWVGVSKFSQGVLVDKNLTANTAAAFVDTYLTVPANSAQYDLQFQLFSRYTHQSVGPILFGGYQWCVSTIDPTGPTAGPCGWAVSPVYSKGGDTFALCLSALVSAGAAARREYFRAAVRSSKYLVISALFMGNDAGSGNNSFVYGDTPGAPSGPANNTAAGAVQNFKTFCQYVEEDLTAIGFDLANLCIVYGPYHTRTSAPNVTLHPVFEQAVCDWIDTGATYSTHACVVRGSRLASGETMLANIWYNNLAQSDQAHRSVAGYLGFDQYGVNALMNQFGQASSNSKIAAIQAAQLNTRTKP